MVTTVINISDMEHKSFQEAVERNIPGRNSDTPEAAEISGQVDPLAGGIREYLNSAGQKYDNATPAELETVVSVKEKTRTSLYKGLQPVIFTWRLENRDAIAADAKVSIQLSKDENFAEYETVLCENFNPKVTVQNQRVWNLMTATTYYWRVAVNGKTISQVQTFTTKEGPGLICTDRVFSTAGTYNMRDLGGWVVACAVVLSDGTVVAKPGDITIHGTVYRSAKLEEATDNDIDLILNKLGIRTEIDLRSVTANNVAERAKTHADLQGSGYWNYIRSRAGTSAKQYIEFINNPSIAGEYLRVFADAENYPIVFHCAGGADRTGALAFILGALQGMSEADLSKDFELTTYRFVDGVTDGSYRDFPGFLKAFHDLEGDNTYEKARTFCRKAGLTDAQIDTIILSMYRR